MDIPIAEILANLAAAAIVYYFSQQQIIYLKSEVSAKNAEILALHDDLDTARAEHMKDVREWAGLRQMGAAWYQPGPSDTKRFAAPTDIDAAEYARTHQSGD